MSPSHRDVQYVIERQLAPSKVLGLFPLGKCGEEYRVTWLSLYAGVLTAGVMAYAGATLFSQHSRNILVILDGGITAVYCAMFASAFLSPVVFWRTFNCTLSSLIKVHNTLQVVNYRISSAYHLLFISGVCIGIRIYFLLEVSKFDKYILFWMGVIASLLISNQFIFLNGIMASQFKALKRELFKKATTRKKYISYDAICSCYQEIVGASINVNKVYSLQLFFVFCNIFFKGTSELYLALNSHIYVSTTDFDTKLASVVKVGWFIVCLGQSIHITRACETTSAEAKKFNTLLYQLMLDDKTNEILNNTKLRLHLSMKRNIVFTACGFFTLDYSLIHSMIASATTYLVILIQFGHESPPPPIQTPFANLSSSTNPPPTIH